MANEDGRTTAMRLGLEDIDGHLDQYADHADPRWQKDRLHALVVRHGLSYRTARGNKLAILTGEKLREWLMSIVRTHKREEYEKERAGGSIFKFGSEMLTAKYLENVGYVKAKTSSKPSQALVLQPSIQDNLAASRNQATQVAAQQDDAVSPEYSLLTEQGLLSAGKGMTATTPQLGSSGPGEKQVSEALGASTESSPLTSLPSEGQTTQSDIVALSPIPGGTVIAQSQGRIETASQATHPLSADRSHPPDPHQPVIERQESGQEVRGHDGAELPTESNGQSANTNTETRSVISQHPESPNSAKRRRDSPAAVPCSKRQKRGDATGSEEAIETTNVSAPVVQGVNDFRSMTGMPVPIPVRTTLQGPPIDLSVAWPGPKYAVPDVLSPGNDWFSGELSRMRTDLENASLAYFSQSEATNSTRPTIVQDPGEHLEKIYVTLFGRNAAGSWKSGAEPTLRDVHDGITFLGAVIGAAVYEMVFTKAVPWESPIDDIERIRKRGFAPYYKVASMRGRSQNFDHESYIYNAAQLQVCDPQFQNSTIRPIAKTLAEDLAIILFPQLKVLGIEKPSKGTQQAFWNRMSAALTYVLTDALIVRGQMQAALNDYQFVWYPAGSQYDVEKMLVTPPVDDGHGEVAFCIVPGIIFRQRPYNEWLSASRAIAYRKVLTVD